MDTLKFSKGNAKLDKFPTTIKTFSLPAGWSCPGAKDCKSKVVEIDGNRSIQDGPDCQFRCFAASQEVVYTNTYNARQHNFRLLKECATAADMADLIQRSLPKRTKIVRVHVSGDFFSQKYFDAWAIVATDNPGVIFYAYTKSIPYVIAHKGTIPANFRLTASIGGRYDILIPTSGLRSARVVYTEAEATSLGLAIDKDDSLAIGTGGDFALLLHGTQPKGSEASEALSKLKKAGKGGYSKVKK